LARQFIQQDHNFEKGKFFKIVIVIYVNFYGIIIKIRNI